MKKVTILCALAVTALALTCQDAFAWKQFKFGIGTNLEASGGGNSFGWGLWKSQQPPAPGYGGFQGGYPGQAGPGYGGFGGMGGSAAWAATVASAATAASAAWAIASARSSPPLRALSPRGRPRTGSNP